MEALRALLPLATFVLGCGFTLYLKRLHDRRELRNESIRQLSALTNAWYNQIQGFPDSLGDLHSSRQQESNEDGRAMYHYVNHRFILPQLLLHLAIVARDRRCSELTRKAREFLDLVSEHHPESLPRDDRQLEASAKILRVLNSRRCLAFRVPLFERELLLKQLDPIVQSIARESGRLLQEKRVG